MKMRTAPQTLALGLSFLLIALISLRANAACPVLMILERSTNSNRVWYEKNEKDPMAPITAKWEMREKGPNRWEPLTALEQKKAYGVKILPHPKDTPAPFVIVGVQKITFALKTDEQTGCDYVSYRTASGPEMNVRKIKLIMKMPLMPFAAKIQFIGTSMNDGRLIETVINL